MIQSVPKAVELGAEGVEPLDEIVKHLADDGVHGTAGALEPSEVGMGGWEGVLKHAWCPEIGSFDTSISCRGGG